MAAAKTVCKEASLARHPSPESSNDKLMLMSSCTARLVLVLCEQDIVLFVTSYAAAKS